MRKPQAKGGRGETGLPGSEPARATGRPAARTAAPLLCFLPKPAAAVVRYGTLPAGPGGYSVPGSDRETHT